ncbi:MULTISPECIES: hypothetical protein [unclassified Mesorhizobium]|uniref:hypothetical protein n=1 Tax=unclassified Mesorhizobium TaxID=325217 RepID=UPI00333C6CFC
MSDDDTETLRHLPNAVLLAKGACVDLGYLEAWCQAALRQPLPWPAREALLIKFVAHRLWDPAKRDSDLARGVPADVSATLKPEGASAQRRAAHTLDGSPAAVELVDAYDMARLGSKVQCSGRVARPFFRRPFARRTRDAASNRLPSKWQKKLIKTIGKLTVPCCTRGRKEPNKTEASQFEYSERYRKPAPAEESA